MNYTLKQIRVKAKESTGRYDLVKETGDADNGMNFFINGAIRYLDGKVDLPHLRGEYKKDVAQGDIILETTIMPRVIESVRMTKSDGTSKLKEKSYDWLRENYTTENWEDIDQGTPLYYMPGIIRLTTDQWSLTGDNFSSSFTYDEGGIAWGENLNTGGITFLPPADATYTASIYGLWFSKMFDGSDDEDDYKNYWSVFYPDILLLAIQMKIEQFMRNMEGTKELKAIIDDELLAVHRAVAMQRSANKNKIKG